MAKQTFTTGQVLTAAQMSSLQQTAMLGGSASAKVASYTLVAADAGSSITMSNASATTITVNTSLFAAGDTVTILNVGAGTCTITAGTATVSKPTNATLALVTSAGGVLYFTATGAATFLCVGCVWGGGCSMTLINTGGTTLTGASVAVGSIPATYRDLRIVAVNFIGATTNTQLRVKITGLGSVFATVNPSDTNPIGVGDPSWYLTDNQVNTGTGYGLAVWTIPEYANTSIFKILTLGNSVQNASATTMNKTNPAMFGVSTSIAAVSSLTFSCTSGNLTSGTVFVYGVQ